MRSKRMFWAILFLSVGVILLLQTIFKIDIPVFRVLVGIFLIYMGVKIIAGSFGVKIKRFQVEKIATETEAVFATNDFKIRKADGSVNRKFSTAFGNSVLDLRGLSGEELNQEIEIDSAFGKTKVLTDAGTPIKADIDAGFASVSIRGQKFGSFGDISYQSPGLTADQPHLKLNIDVGFGEVVVE